MQQSSDSIDLRFQEEDFVEVTGEAAQGLFKYAAFSKINDAKSAADRSALSVAYQTLCDDTALVGVIKQQDKATG